MKTPLRLRGAGRASSAKSISPGSGLDTRFALFPSGAGCFEAVSKKLSTVLGIPGVTATGPSIDLGTTGSRYAPSIVVPSAAFGTGDFAVCVAGTFTPTTTIGVAFSNDANQNGGDYQWRLQPNNNGSSTSSGAFAFQTYGGSFVSAGADALFTAGEYCVFLGVRRGTTVELWKNGVLVASNTGTAQNVSSSETQSIGFGWGPTTTYVAGGHRTLGFGIAGTVQPTVAAALSRDPLHYLAKVNRPLFFDFGAAAGGDTNISASLGTASASGYSATVDRQRTIAASLGTATAQGYAATVNRSHDIAASLGTASATGYAATVNRQRDIAASLGAATAQGYSATISFGSDLNIAASLGIASADGYQANVNLQRDIAASLGTAAALGYQASISDTDPLHGFTQDQLDFLVAYMEANMAIPTAAEIATAIYANTIDGKTLTQHIRLLSAVLGGKVSGAGTGTETFRDIADTVDRVVVTVDSSGNRTAIMLDLD